MSIFNRDSSFNRREKPSVFGGDSSFDLRAYLLEKCNVDICYKSETDKRIVDMIMKEFCRMNAFLGEFRDTVKNGHVRIPWNIDVVSEPFIWLLIADDQRERIVFTYADYCAPTEGCSILKQGSCEFSESGDWILPDTVLTRIGNDTYVWVGYGEYAMIVSEQAHEEARDEFDRDDLLSQL